MSIESFRQSEVDDSFLQLNHRLETDSRTQTAIGGITCWYAATNQDNVAVITPSMLGQHVVDEQHSSTTLINFEAWSIAVEISFVEDQRE